jgi:hypothetical protein
VPIARPRDHQLRLNHGPPVEGSPGPGVASPRLSHQALDITITALSLQPEKHRPGTSVTAKVDGLLTGDA